MDNIITTANKEELEGKVYSILVSYFSSDEIIKFPDARFVVCPRLQITYNEFGLILKQLNRKGFILLVPFHGFKLIRRIAND